MKMKIFCVLLIIIIGLIITFLFSRMKKTKGNKKRVYEVLITGLFVVLATIIGIFLNSFLSKENSPSPPTQSIEGNNNTQQSAQGNINNTQGVPPELVNKWMDMLNRKDKVIQQQGSELQELKKKYFELEKNLEQQKDKITDKPLKEEANQAYLELKEGNFNKAEDIYNKLYNLKKEDIKEAADYAYQLGNVYYTQIKYSEAQKWYEQAVRLSPKNPKYLNSLGMVYYDMGDYKKAIEFFDKSLSITKAVLGEKHPDIADTLNNLGLAYGSMGEYKKAIEYFDKSLSIKKAVLGEKHPSVAVTLNNLGFAYSSKGDYKKAIVYLKKALNINNLVYSNGIHPNLRNVHNNLANAYEKLANENLANEHRKKAEEIAKKLDNTD